MKKIIAIILIFASLFILGGCKSEKPNNEMPEVVTGTLTFKDYGTVTFELYPKSAPQSVYNFIYLVNKQWYNGIIVHRLAKDFVIQAGAYVSGYNQKIMADAYTIRGEFAENGFNNPIKHELGTLSWARTSDPNSASNQFFICTNANTASSLDGRYAAFGKITSGLDIIEKINNIEAINEVPTEEIEIESIKLDSTYTFPEPDFIEK